MIKRYLKTLLFLILKKLLVNEKEEESRGVWDLT